MPEDGMARAWSLQRPGCDRAAKDERLAGIMVKNSVGKILLDDRNMKCEIVLFGDSRYPQDLFQIVSGSKRDVV